MSTQSMMPTKSGLHDSRTAAYLGMALGVCFAICFSTGLLSHLIQHPPTWFEWTSRPAGFYRISQGLHVVTGIATIPLLLAKLWVVADKFWTTPPVRNVAHFAERASLFPLVGGAIFLLFSGLLNVARWYPWGFFFPITHYWAAWITIGGLVIHIGAKASQTIALTRGAESVALGDVEPASRMHRRAFIGGVAATSGLLVAATAGNTVRPLGWLAAFAQRRPGVGPQGLPVQRSAAQSGVEEAATDEMYRLRVTGDVGSELELSLEDLRAMDQHEAELPIACVEGWSQSAHWKGVKLKDVLALAGAGAGATVSVESLQEGGLYRQADVNRTHAQDDDTLLALELNGEVLHVDHGYPVRLIGPNRPGVMQTKWVGELRVTDR